MLQVYHYIIKSKKGGRFAYCPSFSQRETVACFKTVYECLGGSTGGGGDSAFSHDSQRETSGLLREINILGIIHMVDL